MMPCDTSRGGARCRPSVWQKCLTSGVEPQNTSERTQWIRCEYFWTQTYFPTSWHRHTKFETLAGKWTAQLEATLATVAFSKVNTFKAVEQDSPMISIVFKPCHARIAQPVKPQRPVHPTGSHCSVFFLQPCSSVFFCFYTHCCNRKMV